MSGKSRSKRRKDGASQKAGKARREAPAPSLDQILVDVASEFVGPQILCTSMAGGQLGGEVASKHPSAHVYCHFLDVFHAQRATQRFADTCPNLQVTCEADLPEATFDTVAFPNQSGGEAELTREFMQSGHRMLRPGGRMFVCTNNLKDVWLHEQMRKIFAKVTRRTHELGTLYIASKSEPIKKYRDFACEFAFRDRGRLIYVESRPGVFSHRRLDGGARALMNTMEVRPRARVLEIGCGAGAVTFAAACRAEGVSVLAIDSNPRALQCTLRGAERNELDNITVKLDARGECDQPGTYDLALGNPPYFSNFRIAEIFVRAAQRALKPGGEVHLVTQHIDWYLDRLPKSFDDVQLRESGKYAVIVGTQRAAVTL